MWIKHKSMSWPYYLFYDKNTEDVWVIYTNNQRPHFKFQPNVWTLNDILDNIKSDIWQEVTPPERIIKIATDECGINLLSREEEYIQEQCRILELSREQFLKQCVRVYQLYQEGELIRLPETLHKR